MDAIKFKLPLSLAVGRQRFNIIDLFGDICDLEKTGVIANKTDYELGLPNLNRNESINFVLANCLDNTTLIVKLKWRPNAVSQLATFTTDLEFIYDSKVYTYKNTETYKPKSFSHYGSGNSAFKLYIEEPYRHYRLVFRGYMKASGSQDEEKLIKFSVISCPTSLIYDFNYEYNSDAFKESYLRNKLNNKKVANIAKSLFFHDKHEQLVKFVGEISIDSRSKDELTVWGFHSRTFVDSSSILGVNSKHIRGCMQNGQAFHLLQRQKGEDKLDSGYACFKITPLSEHIEKLPSIDWDVIGCDTREFSTDIYGQTLEFKCESKRRADQIPVFDVQLDGVKGWAIISCDEDIDSEVDKVAIEQSFAEYKTKLENNLIHEDKQFDSPGKPLVVSISEHELCCCTDLVGAKAASLAELKRFSEKSSEKYEVPQGVALTRFAYDEFLHHNKTLEPEITKLDEYLGDGSKSDSEVREHCNFIMESFAKAELPESIKSELEAKLKATFGSDFDGAAFAVRSSSWGEDSEEMSAAGQLTTELNVQGIDSICDKVKVCFGSKFSYENAQYKKAHGLSPSLPMAVVVQEMVCCDRAGVLFTSDLIDPRQMIITANYGLGESVVSGQAEPDEIKVKVGAGKDQEPTVADVKIGGKKNIIRGLNDGQDFDTSRCCLSDGDIVRLAKLGRLIAELFGNPRDIEFGLKNDQLFLFQSRPITNIDQLSVTEIIHECDRSSRAECEFATRANIGEVMPFATTPITVTYITRPWAIYGCRQCYRYNHYARELHPDRPYDMFYSSYHAYFGLRCSQIFPLVNPGEEKPLTLRSMEISFFGHEVDYQPDIMEASKNIPRAVLQFVGPKFRIKTLDAEFMPIQKILRELPKLKTVRKLIEQRKPIDGKSSGNSMVDLYENMTKIIPIGARAWENHLDVVFHNNMANFALQSFLSQFITDPKQLFAALNKFLSAPNVLSGEIPKRIARIAELIKLKGPQEVERFLAKDTFANALDYLKNSDAIISEEYEKFIEKFGHRCYNEFEVRQKPWGEDQAPIVEMIKLNCQTAKDIDGKNVEEAPQKNEKLSSNDKIIKSLNLDLTWTQTLKLRVLASKSQTLVQGREFSKDTLIYYTDILRTNIRNLAREMKRNLRIPDEDLLHFFFYKEIGPLIKEPQPAIVSRVLYRRSVHSKVFAKTWAFDEIIRGHNLPPIVDKELDEAVKSAPKLNGNPASFGKAKGPVCIVHSLSELSKVKPGDILITHSTDIGFSPVFPIIAGLVTEMGGMISHGAVVAREYGLPCLLAMLDATKILDEGEQVLLDADNGYLLRLSKQSDTTEITQVANGEAQLKSAN